MRPGWAVLGRKQRGRDAVPIEEWDEFAREVREAADLRVCVSTEDFGSASPAQARRIVDDLGGDRVHVVAVTRRLDKLLPSQWQERVKSHDTLPYEDWLRVVLGDDEDHLQWKKFWASHDMVRLFERWSSAVGPERFRLVVSDDSDPELLPRVFERMLGLPTDLLQLAPYDNASLTWSGTELVRRLNEVFLERGWPDDVYYRVMQRGLMQALMAAPRSEHEGRIPRLPKWAAARAAELTDARIERIRSLGITVVGDLEQLRLDPEAFDGEHLEAPDRMAVGSATAAVTGAVEGALELRRRTRRQARRAATPAPAAGPTVDDLSGRQLVREVARRAARKVRRRS
jgi:hypothetical protein